MPRATLIVRRVAVRPQAVADTVTLDLAGRSAQRGELVTASGLAVELDLPQATRLEDGDALRLDDGRLVAVRAGEEALLEVSAGSPARLLRLAWQLGGNHVPVEVADGRLYAPASAAELVRGSGCEASPVTRPFRPEKDAHDHSRCGHDHGEHQHQHHTHAAHDHAHHGHDRTDDHAHGSDHAHGHDHSHDHAHDHGTHDHAHGH